MIIYIDIFIQTYLVKITLLNTDFCHLLVIFANRLDQDQDQRSVGPGLNIDVMKEFLKKLILKKINRQQQKYEKLPSMHSF